MKRISTLLFLLVSLAMMAQSTNSSKTTANAFNQAFGQTYAVVVGISDYQDKGIPDLQFADIDAKAFAAFLQSPAGGGLDEDRIKVLLNEQATVAQFAMALDWLWESVGERDRVIIYFSGHGDVERKSITQPGYLLCWDAPARVYMAGGAFNVRDLNDVVSTLSLQNKAKVILVSDACRAGKLSGSNIGGAQATASNLSKLFANEIKILSCQPDEYSIEGEQWNGGRGAFSYHLINGLTGMADSNDDQVVDLKEIGRYLEDYVTQEVAPESQNPMVVGNKTEKLTAVVPELLTKLKEGKKGQLQFFTSTQSRGIEDEVLAAADSSVVEMYLKFKQAVSDQQFFEPELACADYYYEILIKEPQLERLYSSMRRNYAAALQDDAQQVLNSILNQSIEQAVQSEKTKSKKYEPYPRYLERAAELLGPDHYMYNVLQARKSYFEGRLLYFRKDFEDNLTRVNSALEKYRNALKWNRDLPHVYHSMTECFSSLEELDSMNYYFNLTTEMAPSWLYPYLTMSHRYSFRNKFDEAWTYLHQAMEIDSNSTVVLMGQGDLYMDQFNSNDAIRCYKKALALDSSFSTLYNKLALSYATSAQYEMAEKYYLKALDIDSTQYHLYGNLARVYSHQQKDEKAEYYHKKFIKLNPLSVVGRTNYGYYLNQRTRYDEAIEQFKAAIQIDSFNKYPYINLCFLHSRLANHDSAIVYCTKCLDKGGDVPEMRFFLGHAYLEEEQYEKAEIHFLKILEQSDQFPGGWAGLAVTYHFLGEIEKSAEMLEQVHAFDIKADGELQENYRRSGLTNCMSLLIQYEPHYPDAEKLCKKLLAYDPDDGYTRLKLANVLCRQEKIDEALEAVEWLFDAGYIYKEAQENEDFEILRSTAEYKALVEKYFPDQE